ncbi:MAG: hypothetical protein EOP86_20400 [Verrucomicrobiaceae bacterium]|nr:MAG: hypothetical protein EOP86_20400 [Verrucomicrobiaceae bacterium]
METAAAPLMERWVAETPEKAVDWILNETAATSAGTRQLMEPALRAWGKKSSSEAWRWMENRIAADPGQADRFYGALLDSQEAVKPNNGTLVDRWLSDSWAAQITSASPQSRDAFLHYWAGQWLTFAAQEGLPAEEALTRWQSRIAEAGGDSASGRLAMQALQIAEQAAADTAPALNSPSAREGGSVLSTQSTIQPR